MKHMLMFIEMEEVIYDYSVLWCSATMDTYLCYWFRSKRLDKIA
jgi:hypothetical protein